MLVEVNIPIYRLVELLLLFICNAGMGCCFITDFGELILSAFKRENLHAMEEDLLKSFVEDEDIFMVSRYNFSMPVVYEYVRSEFPGDFEDFVEMVSEPEKI